MSLSDEQRKYLVQLAAASVASAVNGSAAPQADDAQGILGEKRGCFVTLTNAGALRGCIGIFSPDRPLAEMIIEMARSAAADSRFVNNPITASELDQLTVEVSVLSELALTDEPENLEIGVHGIYVTCMGQSGCFLPEVATDQGWTAEQFLDYCCASKAGLPADAWKDPQAKVYLFTSEKFSG